MAYATINVVIDFIIYIMPMPAFYKLQLPLSQRIGLIILFSVGSIVVVAGVMREYYIHITVYKTYDVTWEGYDLWIWTAVEVNLGVICGSVPSLKPLLFRSRSRNTSYYSQAYGMSSNITSDRIRMTRRTRDEETDILTDAITVKHDVIVGSTRKATSGDDSRVRENNAEWSSASSIDHHVTAWDGQRPGQGRS